jgi:hypothetical protein
MRVPLKRGRFFGATDRLVAPKVVLINETAARAFWPSENPLGKRIGLGMGDFDGGAEVVGIVGDVRQAVDSAAKPDVYLPYSQSPSGGMMISYGRRRTRRRSPPTCDARFASGRRGTPSTTSSQ